MNVKCFANDGEKLMLGARLNFRPVNRLKNR